MISVKIKETMFAVGRPFYGMDRSRAVIIVGGGRNDLPIHKRHNMPITSLAYRGHSEGLQIDTRGTEFENIMLETIIKNENYRASYGAELINLVERDYIEVCQDGVALTAVALRVYAAP